MTPQSVERPISMTDDDHERIWLQPKCCAGEFDDRQWCEDNVFDDSECEDGTKATEYVRADIAATRLVELLKERDEARNRVERLGEALKRIANYKWPVSAGTHKEKYYGEATGNEYTITHHVPKEMASGALQSVKAIARAALTEKHNG